MAEAASAPRAPLTLADVDRLLDDYEEQLAGSPTTEEQRVLVATRDRLLLLRRQLLTGPITAVDWSLLASGPRGSHPADFGMGQLGQEQIEEFYQRLNGFTAATEMLGAIIDQMIAIIRREQDEWYVFSDRTFTRPVVLKAYADAKGFAGRAWDFCLQNADADPALTAQLRADLEELDRKIGALRGATPAPMGGAERTGRRFVGGVKGAGGAFLGFLRLGLIDSWGQFLFDGSERRIAEAQEGFGNMLESIDEKGFTSTVSDAVTSGLENIERAEALGYHTQAAEIFGSGAFDIYFMGRGLLSGVKGGVQFSKAVRAYRAMGATAPVRQAMATALREAATFRGVGVHGGGGVWGSQYGMAGMGETVVVTRVIDAERDLIAKHWRPPGAGGSQQLLLPESGSAPPVGAVERAHISTSAGSPYQSGFPMGDIETYILANPQNFGVAGQGGTVVRVRVPTRGLVDANRMLVERAGQSVAEVSAIDRGMFGRVAPEQLRPATLPEYRMAGDVGEARVWVEQQFGVQNRAALGVFRQEGTPFYEWEQLMLAPDLRPYVTGAGANPFANPQTNPLLPLSSGRAPFYHPALNPAAASGLARSFPEGWQAFQGYSGWLRGGTGAARGFTPSEIAGFERMTVLGGGPLATPWVAPWTGGASTTSAAPAPSEREIEGYMLWAAAAGEGASELLGGGPTAGGRGMPGSQTGPSAEASTRSAALAAEARGMGAMIRALRIGPGLATMTIVVPDSQTVLRALLQAVARHWEGIAGEVRASIEIVIEADRSSHPDEVDLADLGVDVDLPPGVRLILQRQALEP
jgi:hypothetical protein